MIVCEKARLTYTAVPKNACTSMKCFFYHVNTGDDFAEVTPKKNLGYQGIHHVDGYRMHRFRARDYGPLSHLEHVAIIRDPLDRFRSAFKNRLFQYNDIRNQPKARRRAEELDLELQPSFGTFIDRLEDYLDASRVVLFHLRPASFFLGGDLGFYHHVYPIARTEDLCELVRQRSGCDVATVRANESHAAEQPDYRLSAAQFDKLNRYLARDYEFLSDYYSPRRYEELPADMLAA